LSLDRCLFLARVSREDDREELARRVERLARWHGGKATWTWAGPNVAAGVVRYDERDEDLGAPLVFGEPLPGGIGSLLDAEPESLRALDGAGAALEIEPARAGIVAYAGGPGTLYSASCGPIDAWSTHAVAAAWLALGQARVDPAAIPEQLAAEFVGGERCLIERVRPLAQAVRVVADGEGAHLTDYWPLGERWAALPEDEAAAHAEQHLLETLARRARAFGAEPHASLTAGLDSRVTAVALREAGIAPRGFTWGEPDWDDVRGGAEVARRLGLEHELVGIEWLDDAEAMREVDRQVRWTEGGVPVGFARLAWPADMHCFVTGAGGEVGRAFYYDDAEEADGGWPEDLIVEVVTSRLPDARLEALQELTATLNLWVSATVAAGFPGFRALDVIYGEQRVRRWLRGMLPRLAAPMVPAFATPEVARALASLPLADRMSSGFHRGFLERRAPELAGPVVEPPPRPPRRLRLPWRREAPPSFLGRRWDEHPGFHDWVAEGVLGSPLLVEPLGERWANRTRERFLARDGDAERMALSAAGPVALAEALKELDG
jgi:hypothetical protein